jgi:hypothetical protein
MSGPINTRLTAALALAAHGLKVFPVQSGTKLPLTPHAHQDASSDPVVLERWWRETPAASIGISCAASGLVVIDVDAHAGGPDGRAALAELEAEHGALPPTWESLTGNGGRHLYFRTTADRIPAALAPGIDLKRNGYVVAPPSRHATGRLYTWAIGSAPGDLPLAELPPWVLTVAARCKQDRPRASRARGIIQAGERNTALTSLAGSWRRQGLDAVALTEKLLQANARRCRPPLEEDEVRRIAERVASYPVGGSVLMPESTPDDRSRNVRGGAVEANCGPALDLAGLKAVFAEHLLIEDGALLNVVVGTVLSHRLGGDPVWPLIVGPPGSAKTEILRSLYGIPGIFPLSELTPRTFASGLNESKGGDPSLLAKLTTEILVLKDFTTVLEGRREDRQCILAQLREIYDGSYSKAWGSGKQLTWEGRLGFLAGVTPVIDSHHAALAVVGERFILFRPTSPDRRGVAMKALRGARRESVMRQALRDAMARFVAARGGTPPTITEARLERLAAVADFVTRARSGVEREGYKRTIEYGPEPESPTRFAKILLSLAQGVALAHDRDEVTDAELRLASRIALDSLPAIRRRALQALAKQEGPVSTVDVSVEVRAATTAARRALEDLEALDVVTCDKGSKTYAWCLAPEWRPIFGELTAAAVTHRRPPDISGTMPEPAPDDRSRNAQGAAAKAGNGDELCTNCRRLAPVAVRDTRGDSWCADCLEQRA